MKVSKDKIIKIAITLILLLVIVLLAIYIQKNEVLKLAEDKAQEQIKAEVQDDIQSIIDDTKSSVEQNESREATISDLKEELKALGYILDETTGRVEYRGYLITVDGNLNIANVEEMKTEAYYRVMSVDGENLDILLTIENPKGIDKIMAEDITVEGNGKEIVAIDRTLKEGEEYQLRLKIEGEESEELYTLVATAEKLNIVVTNEDTLGDGTTKTIEIQYPDNENLINYYSIDNEKTWQEYTGALDVLTTEGFQLSTKSIWKEGNTIFNLESSYLVVDNSLLSLADKISGNGYYLMYVQDEIYTAHAYVLDEDTILTRNTTYGDANDVATASTDAQNMVIVKVNGDLTINSGVTVTAYGTQYGGPKGMLIYTTGKLTNNGTITMTARGAKAEGQNVYLWENEDESIEYIPKIGMNGGTGGQVVSWGYDSRAGNTPTAATNRKTGGGGGGAGVLSYSKGGNGGTGTSYSGGSGGGGGAGNKTGNSASPNGSAGGTGNAGTTLGEATGAGGGAGNPGGKGNYTSSNVSGYAGANGTGGLLIVSANTFQNNSIISADGTAGGKGKAGGGGSGGGSINIFCNIMSRKGTITVSGGAGGKNEYGSHGKYGGSGGSGCVSIGSIASGTYVAY